MELTRFRGYRTLFGGAPHRSFVPFKAPAPRLLRSRFGSVRLGRRDAPGLRRHIPGLVPARVSVMCQTCHAQIQGIEHPLVPDGRDRYLSVVGGVCTPRVLAAPYRAHQSDGPELLRQVHALEDSRVSAERAAVGVIQPPVPALRAVAPCACERQVVTATDDAISS